MAFTVSDDHAAQEALWESLPDYNRQPGTIRKALTEAHVSADDRRVRFVGIDAYHAAGGAVLRDMFQPEHAGYLTDPALLDRLVAQTLEAAAQEVRAEGWKWVETAPCLDRFALQGFARVHAERPALPAEHVEAIDRLRAEYDALAEAHEDDLTEEAMEKLEAIDNEISRLSHRESVWRQDDMAHAGAIVTLGHHGGLAVERGLVRPEDEESVRGSADEEASGEETNTAASADPAAPLSARLVQDLTAQRTAALRKLMADDTRVALIAVAHALALPLLYGHTGYRRTCLTLSATSRDLRPLADGIAESSAAQALACDLSLWRERLPADADSLFGWLLAQDMDTVTRLLAVCAAGSIDAVRGKLCSADHARLAHADQLAVALGLDLSQWWQPTKASYLGRVSKPLILEAVTEGVSARAARSLAKLKKDAMASLAEERLAGRRWIPAFLRPVEAVADTVLAA